MFISTLASIMWNSIHQLTRMYNIISGLITNSAITTCYLKPMCVTTAWTSFPWIYKMCSPAKTKFVCACVYVGGREKDRKERNKTGVPHQRTHVQNLLWWKANTHAHRKRVHLVVRNRQLSTWCIFHNPV